MTFTDNTHQKLKEIKGERSWEEATIEEYGVEEE
jgi:hypothetical protein